MENPKEWALIVFLLISCGFLYHQISDIEGGLAGEAYSRGVEDGYNRYNESEYKSNFEYYNAHINMVGTINGDRDTCFYSKGYIDGYEQSTDNTVFEMYNRS